MAKNYVLFKQDNREDHNMYYPTIMGVYGTFAEMKQAFENDLANEREEVKEHYMSDLNVDKLPENAITEEIDISEDEETIYASCYTGDYIFVDDLYGVKWHGLCISEALNDKRMGDKTLFLYCGA